VLKKLSPFFLLEKEDMKVKYSPEEDILMYKVSRAPIDYAEEVGNIIVHYSKKRKPVLLEILNASKFLNRALAKVPATVSVAA
jgi:uncharacterized protein YuzE